MWQSQVENEHYYWLNSISSPRAILQPKSWCTYSRYIGVTKHYVEHTVPIADILELLNTTLSILRGSMRELQARELKKVVKK